MLRELMKQVAQKYNNARNQPFAGNETAKLLTREIPATLSKLLADQSHLVFRGSAGQSRWAVIPWVAVFDPDITETAEKGHYVVFLFSEDMRYLYLVIGHGVTAFRAEHKKKAQEVMKARSKEYFAWIKELVADSRTGRIDLRIISNTNVGKDYEAGGVCHIRYPLDDLPSDKEIESDLRRYIHANRKLADCLLVADNELAIDFPDDDADYEDTSKRRWHSRIERNSGLSKKAKKIHGYTCQVCDFNFESVYGEIGSEFIEAHHLVPLSVLEEGKHKRDPQTDFAVVCSNCHRMLHRQHDPSDLDALRAQVETSH